MLSLKPDDEPEAFFASYEKKSSEFDSDRLHVPEFAVKLRDREDCRMRLILMAPTLTGL